MTDWRKVAAGVDPAIDVEKIVPVLEALERSFKPLVRAIPAGAEIWTGPEDLA
jgi:hypothetical protein